MFMQNNELTNNVGLSMYDGMAETGIIETKCFLYDSLWVGTLNVYLQQTKTQTAF